MDPTAVETYDTRVDSANLGLRERIYRFGTRAYWTGAVTSLALFVALAPASPTAALVASFGMIACVLLMALGLAVGAPRTQRGPVSLGHDGLTLRLAGAEVAVARDDIAEAYLRRTAWSWQLRVRTRAGARYDIDLPDEATAARWLRALNLDVGERAARVVTDRVAMQWAFAYFFGSMFSAPALALLMAIMALFHRDLLEQPWGLTFTYLVMMPGMWLAARTVGRVDVTVGVDGVRAGRGWWRRFFPLRDIARVELVRGRGDTLLLVMNDGGSHRYRFATDADAFAAGRRIRDLLALRDEGAPPEALRVLGADRADEPEAWRDAFVEALRGGAYRELVLTPDAVARVVTSPSVTAAQRIGAALALREVQPDAERSGVRIAEEAMVDPDAHDALHDVAPEEESLARRATR